MKTHANFIKFCSTYIGGCYGPDWKFGGMKKGVKWSKKGVKTLIERNFHMKTYGNLILFCSTYLGGCYGTDWKSEGVKRRCEMVQKGVKTLI